MAAMIKFTLSLEQGLYTAYEHEADRRGMPVLDLLRDTLQDHAERAGWDTGDPGFDLHLYRRLTMEVADAAERITSEEGWNEDITLRAIKDRQNDPDWLADYQRLIGDKNVYVSGNAVKSSVNQNFGQYVKARLKAKVKQDADKRVTRQVAGELVRSYTLLVPGS